jgi:hypothetical protein
MVELQGLFAQAGKKENMSQRFDFLELVAGFRKMENAGGKLRAGWVAWVRGSAGWELAGDGEGWEKFG